MGGVWELLVAMDVVVDDFCRHMSTFPLEIQSYICQQQIDVTNSTTNLNKCYTVLKNIVGIPTLVVLFCKVGSHFRTRTLISGHALIIIL